MLLLNLQLRSEPDIIASSDVDIVGNGSVFEIEKKLEKTVPVMKNLQDQTGVKLFMGNSQSVFSPEIYERCCHQSRFYSGRQWQAFSLRMQIAGDRSFGRRELRVLGRDVKVI